MVLEADVDDRDWVSAPAVTMLAQMRRRGVSAGLLAAALDGGAARLRTLLEGSEPIDAATAEVLASLLGAGREFWLRRESQFELHLDRAVQRLTVDEGEELLKRARLPGASRRDAAAPRDLRLRRLLAFYCVSGIADWERRYGARRGAVVFRTSPSFAAREGPTALWLRRGEIASGLVATGSFDRGALLASIPEVRRLSGVRQLERCLPALRALLASCGVALVVELPPDGCRASGAARFVEPSKAMLLLSLRHRSDDHLWFTILHELGHLVLHSDGAFVDEEGVGGDAREEEADRFAAEAILPPTRDAELRSLPPRHRDVTRFAVSVGVAPGLIVGRLQHLGLLGRDRLNFLKRRFDAAEVERVAAIL